MDEKRTMVTPDLLKIIKYEITGKLPDPFLFEDGQRVATEADWAARKKELYKSVIELQYGVQPPAPELMAVEMLYNGDKTRVYRIKSGTEAHPVTFRMKLILPDNAVNPPVIVDGDGCFNYSMDKQWLGAALERGVAWAIFDRTEIANDVMGEKRGTGQLFEAYPGLECGALSAWAWGYSRVVDALEQIGLVNLDCIAFTGHSRGGKTCALAGALDERAAIVNPNETCAGSCSCYRSHLVALDENGAEARSERLSDLWRNFYYWIGEGMGEYAARESELPFDCHELKAMIAPRTLFLSEAAHDIWSNPVGAWQTTVAAKEVYDFLGAGDELFWYFRPGRHAHKTEDVEMLVSLIKRMENGGKDFDDSRFFRLPFEETAIPPIYDWKNPKRK